MARCDKDWAWTVRLEDPLGLNVAGCSEWIQVPKNEQTPLRLFVDGVEVPSLTVRRATDDRVAKVAGLRTVLTFDADGASAEERAAGRRALASILRTARSNAWRYGRNDMTVSIGPAGGPQWPTTAKLRINAYPTLLTVLAAVGVLVLAILLVVLAVRTPLLRDSGGMTAPFSLAKNQMAVWFLVIFGSFLFVTVTTGQAAAMSQTALALIGISGATGLAAVAMDNRKRTVEGDERRALEAEKTTIQQELDGAGGLREKRAAVADGSADAAELDAKIQPRLQRREVVNKALEEKQTAREQNSQGSLADILSDENGVSFHRVQMLAWTLALVSVFVVAVWRTFAMPEFDNTMLLLLGISSGTYLGFKLPERAAPSGTPTK
jgi:hypothetical protein